MARPGISYLDVAKTAIKLVEQKIYPSIEEIRKTLGTGSNSTINRHLREWRSKQGNQFELEQGLPEPLLLAVRGIYDGVKEEAASKINIIESESIKAVAELKTTLATVETEQIKLLQTNKSLEDALNQHQEANLALQRMFNKLEMECSKKADQNNLLQERLADQKSTIDTLKQQLKHTQDNLDHYRETVKQTRETENNLLNEQNKSLERQLYQQQIIAGKAAEQVTILSREIRLLEDTNKATLLDLNEVLADRQEQKNTIKHQTLVNNELSEKYNNILSDNIKLTNELKTEKEVILILRINLEKAQERITMLDQALEKAETKVMVISDQNLFLSQEKAELAYQLKQFQTCMTQSI
jgi:chromosome segregation ATPase